MAVSEGRERTPASVRNRYLRMEKGQKMREQGRSKNRCAACGLKKLGHVCQAKLNTSTDVVPRTSWPAVAAQPVAAQPVAQPVVPLLAAPVPKTAMLPSPPRMLQPPAQPALVTPLLATRVPA